jgi:uncharacterized protein (DUF305 family)
MSPMEPGLRWRAALLFGLLSSTWSTLVSQFTAGRIGRDAAADWMIVAAIPLRDWALQVEPGWGVLAAGVLFHQWADFSWAVVFFGLLGRWTAGLGPLPIALVAPAWALFTSAVEWLLLVPVLPFWQPVFTLNQPYWIGLLVHLTAAASYPLFPWIRDRVAGLPSSPHRRFTAWWAGGGALGLAALGLLAWLGAHGREWPGHAARETAFDQAFMRRMAAHHAQGITLGQIGAQQAEDPHLRALARMMVATQRGEVAVFRQWWRSWFDGELPAATVTDHASMPGMLMPEELERLRAMPPGSLDRAFVALMTHHHRGAIAMADEAVRGAGDLRLRLMAHATRHSQRGEIELMQGRQGFAAVGSAVANMIRPAGAAPPDGTLGEREPEEAGRPGDAAHLVSRRH